GRQVAPDDLPADVRRDQLGRLGRAQNRPGRIAMGMHSTKLRGSQRRSKVAWRGLCSSRKVRPAARSRVAKTWPARRTGWLGRVLVLEGQPQLGPEDDVAILDIQVLL